MVYVAALLAVACFAVGLELVRVVPVAAKAVEVSRGATASIRDASLTDQEKERRLRAASFTLMATFFSILLRGVGAIAASFVPLVLFQALGVARVSEAVEALATWQAIVVVTLIMGIFYLVRGLR